MLPMIKKTRIRHNDGKFVITVVAAATHVTKQKPHNIQTKKVLYF